MLSIVNRNKLRAQTHKLTPYVQVLVPAIFFFMMLVFFPFHTLFEIDGDEGVEAMKAFMLLRGYPLYRAIWSDHPPLFTFLLAGAFKLFGADINVGRILVLVFSSILLWAGYAFLQRFWGHVHALAGAVLILLSPYYLILSVSNMIGLPAISLAMLALLFQGLWHRRRSRIWLGLSALMMGLSVLTKMITAFLAPIFLVGILVDGWYISRRNLSAWRVLLGPAVLWGLVFGAVVLLLVPIAGLANLSQLIAPHLGAQGSQLFQQYTQQYSSIDHHLAEARWTLLLAAAGVTVALLSRQWLALYPAAWAASSYILLTFQIPVWYHHSLLVTIPAALLAGIAVGEAIRAAISIVRSGGLGPWIAKSRAVWAWVVLYAVALTLFALILVVKGEPAIRQFTRVPYHKQRPLPPDRRAERVVREMRRHSDGTQWVFTDWPMFAFRAQLPIPPDLTVLSSKRLESGEITEAEIIQRLEEVRPEQVFTMRLKLPALKQYLENNYEIEWEWGNRRLYLRQP